MIDTIRGQRAKMDMIDDVCSLTTEAILDILKPLTKTAIATGCPLCDKIWSSKEAYQDFVGDHWEEQIVVAMENGKPYLYIPIQMDSYYSDTYLQINWCPKCGRRLIEE